MEFGLSEEDVMLQDSVNRFLDQKVPLARVREFAENPDSGDIWHGLADLGVTGLLIHEAHGGVGLGCFQAAVVAEALGYHCCPVPYLGSAVMLPLAIRHAGAREAEVLAELASGSRTAGVALSDAIGIRADGGVRGDGRQLNGKALYVTDFDADCYLTADADRRLYLVPADAPGLERVTLGTIDKTRRTGTLKFTGTPAACLSDDPTVFDKVLDAGRVMLAADTLGAAQNMLDQAVAYAKERKQFNRPIGSFQAVKHMCAEMAAALEPCRAMVWYAAHALDALPEESRLAACHTKAHLAEVGKRVAKSATEVHGGMGFTDLLGLHYWFKRIGYNRQMLGAPELVREDAARAQGFATGSKTPR